MLSIEYDDCFSNMVQQFGSSNNNEDSEYFAFYPSFGVKKNSPVDFLVYGQALNGWGDECKFKAGDETTINNICDKTYRFSNEYFPYDNHGPLDWVNVQWCNSEYDKFLRQSKEEAYFKRYYVDKYRAYRSFFWNVVYKTVSDYKGPNNRETRNWADYVIYSNLYKISPSPKGNPDEIVKNAQIESAVKLVKMEIEELEPKFCLVLTNLEWWDPFLKALSINLEEIKTKSSEVVDYVAKYKNGTLIIVTKRPRVGDSDKYAKEIIKIIKQ